MSQQIADSLARAILDARTGVVTHVPGRGGTEVFAAYCAMAQQPHAISFHEEVAYTIAHGASLVGKRSAAIIKAHGLVKAANSVLDSLFAGTTAGFLVLVFEDPNANSSDSIFDAGAFLDGVGIPYHRAESATMYQEVLCGFEASERMRLPYALLINADDVQAYAPVLPARSLPTTATARYCRNVAQHVVCPLFAQHQYEVLSAKRCGDDWTQIMPPGLPRIPECLPEKWQSTVREYQPLFDVFRDVRGTIVTGDTSTPTLFALPPYACVDLTTYMGGSLPLAIGAALAGHAPVWALTGDFSFLAAGQLGLPEALQRGIPLKVLIFDNGRADATGGQPIPEPLLEASLGGYRDYVRYIHQSDDVDEIRRVFMEANTVNELRIIVAEYRGISPHM